MSNQTAQKHESPISNLLYDVVTIMHTKGKGLVAYEKYLKDAEGHDEKLTKLLKRLKQQDIEAVEELKEYLTACLRDDKSKSNGAAPNVPTDVSSDDINGYSPPH
jgi:hypothetical protein